MRHNISGNSANRIGPGTGGALAAQHVPATTETVLVHGDFRVGNLMIGPEGLRGVFDWEFAHVGDPAEDLAWPCVRSWRFGQDQLRLGGVGDVEEFFTSYEQASGRAVDRRAIAFWEILGNFRWAIGCIQQAHRHLSGQAVSIELASLGGAQRKWNSNYSTSSNAPMGAAMHDRPTAVELVNAVRQYLESELLPTLTDARFKFQTLIAANVLAIASASCGAKKPI